MVSYRYTSSGIRPCLSGLRHCFSLLENLYAVRKKIPTQVLVYPLMTKINLSNSQVSKTKLACSLQRSLLLNMETDCQFINISLITSDRDVTPALALFKAASFKLISPLDPARFFNSVKLAPFSINPETSSSTIRCSIMASLPE